MVIFQELEPILAGAPENEANLPTSFLKHFRLATEFYNAGDFRKALGEIEAAISLGPNYPEAHNNRGVALRRYLGQHEEALAAYERAIELRPDYAEAHYNRGVALANLERYEEALVAFGRAIELRPDFVEAHYNQGLALGKLERYEEALEAYERTLVLCPDLVEAHNNLGDALYHLKRYREALMAFERALALRPGYAQARDNRRITLEQLLLDLVRRGIVSWRGGKPKGLDPPIVLTPGPTAAEIVIKDRR
ncbi:MAG TPA: tetratricopeptide repeat protein [Dehalococcoidia bacterium]|nr:tetratricopeptide repeat protein [Dehalococcoidia bacterium]